MRLVVDPDDFDIGDMEDFEDAVGVPLNEALKPVVVRDPETNEVVRGEDGRPELEVKVSAKALRHLVWILQRKTDPDFTPEQARKVKVSSLEIVTKEEDAAGNADGNAANDDSASVAP